jgi:hypothetical protein
VSLGTGKLPSLGGGGKLSLEAHLSLWPAASVSPPQLYFSPPPPVWFPHALSHSHFLCLSQLLSLSLFLSVPPAPSIFILSPAVPPSSPFPPPLGGGTSPPAHIPELSPACSPSLELAVVLGAEDGGGRLWPGSEVRELARPVRVPQPLWNVGGTCPHWRGGHPLGSRRQLAPTASLMPHTQDATHTQLAGRISKTPQSSTQGPVTTRHLDPHAPQKTTGIYECCLCAGLPSAQYTVSIPQSTV